MASCMQITLSVFPLIPNEILMVLLIKHKSKIMDKKKFCDGDYFWIFYKFLCFICTCYNFFEKTISEMNKKTFDFKKK